MKGEAVGRERSGSGIRRRGAVVVTTMGVALAALAATTASEAGAAIIDKVTFNAVGQSITPSYNDAWNAGWADAWTRCRNAQGARVKSVELQSFPQVGIVNPNDRRVIYKETWGCRDTP